MITAAEDTTEAEPAPAGPADIAEPTLWRKAGWTAKVIKNDDDEGWAVEMLRQGDSEPALVGPWVMGRDKKNPKPLNPKDFSTLVKTATEVLERAASAQKARLHKSLDVVVDGAHFRVDLDIAADEDDPHAIVAAFDAAGACLGSKRVEPHFKLGTKSATEVINSFT